MLTRSQSTLNASNKESSFYSAQLKKALEARMLKKSRNMYYYIIVESNYDTTKRQVQIVAEVAVRASSLSIDLSNSFRANSALLEQEIREHLITNNHFAHRQNEHYPSFSYQ